MKIIEKIEIKNFRSFLGTPKVYATELNSLSDINIFSGANDSGKSNVLRALNLFFNDEISYNVPLDFDRDFFVGKAQRVQKVIEISISFDLSSDKKDAFLPDKFKISKFYDREGFRNYVYSFYLKEKDQEIKIDSRAAQNGSIKEIFKDKENADKREWIYRVKFAGFLNKSIGFEYVPAIRDKDFFAQLFGRVINRIKSNEDGKLAELQKEKNKIINWEKTLRNKTEKKDFKNKIQDKVWRNSRIAEIEENEKQEGRFTAAMISLENEINDYSAGLIKSLNFLPTEFRIGKDLREFFEGFDIGTGDEKEISLKLRGDGIQAKFIPKILDFLSGFDFKNKYYLWGFEEPENSAEYKNQQELANEFKDGFSQSKQIFLTTHSEEFLQLYDGPEVVAKKRRATLYHVKKLRTDNLQEYSQIFLFDVDKNEFEFLSQRAQLDADLGQSHLRAKYSKELKEREDGFLLGKTRLEKENSDFKNMIQLNNKPIVFVEDQYTQIYKIAWLKLKDKPCTSSTFERKFDQDAPFTIFSSGGASSLAGFLRMKNVDYLKNKSIIGIFDFDKGGVEQFKTLKNETYWKTPLAGEKIIGIYRKRIDHRCFYAMLIPIPSALGHLADIDFPSVIEIENLLPSNFLKDNNFATECITTGNTTFLKIKDDKKNVIWKKLFMLNKQGFENFHPLFNRINALLASDINPTNISTEISIIAPASSTAELLTQA